MTYKNTENLYNKNCLSVNFFAVDIVPCKIFLIFIKQSLPYLKWEYLNKYFKKLHQRMCIFKTFV